MNSKFILFLASVAFSAHAQPLQILHHFGDGSVTNDANEANGLIQAADGNYYGSSYLGGSDNYGTVFKMTPTGTVTIMHSFGDGSVSDDGIGPFPRVVQASNGKLFGTTRAGGSANYGTIYRMSGSGTLIIAHHFGDGSTANDGIYPEGPLFLAADGNFYGTTELGGTANKGIIYKLTSGGTYSIIHHFADGSVTNDGANPGWYLSQASNGKIYGVTAAGGSAGYGTVFRFGTVSGAFTIVHHFGDGTVASDGHHPVNVIQGDDGDFYGTTILGGSYSSGTAFKLTASGTLTLLHHFGAFSTDGQYPGPLTKNSKGQLLGETQYIVGTGAPGDGTIFEVTPDGRYAILDDFKDCAISNNASRPEPTSPLYEGSDGLMYGTTYLGGSAGKGVAFKFDPISYFVIHQMGSQTGDGSLPSAGLIQDSSGNFYGTTLLGGAPAKGILYKITASGVFTTMHTFGDGSVTNDGAAPSSNMIIGTDGNFYGTTSSGGNAGNYGTVYKMTPAGVLTILYRFSGASDGSEPNSSIVQATDGNFYGTTNHGGSSDYGTVFKLTPSGTLTTLRHFAGGSTDGRYPTGSIIQATDGNLYGTTTNGGTANKGVAYKITLSGTFTLLHQFSGTSDGTSPTGVIQAADGNLYGQTNNGGSANSGTVFKMTTAGTFTTLYHFPGGTCGSAFPGAKLIQGSDGNFYSTASAYSSSGLSGTLFRMTSTGTYTPLHRFGTSAMDGAFPNATLFEGSNGKIYGTTTFGGTSNLGTVFELTP